MMHLLVLQMCWYRTRRGCCWIWWKQWWDSEEPREEVNLIYRNLVLLGWKKVDKLVYPFAKIHCFRKCWTKLLPGETPSMAREYELGKKQMVMLLITLLWMGSCNSTTNYKSRLGCSEMDVVSQHWAALRKTIAGKSAWEWERSGVFSVAWGTAFLQKIGVEAENCWKGWNKENSDWGCKRKIWQMQSWSLRWGNC